MNDEEKRLIKESWKKVAPIADTAVRMFYDRLFESDPTTRPLFKTTDLDAQRQKLIQALSMIVQSLDRLDSIVPAVAELGRRHAQYRVTDRHYEAAGAALLWTLEQGLGSDWTAEIGAAWSNAYTVLSGVMRDAAVDGRTPAG